MGLLLPNAIPTEERSTEPISNNAGAHNHVEAIVASLGQLNKSRLNIREEMCQYPSLNPFFMGSTFFYRNTRPSHRFGRSVQ